MLFTPKPNQVVRFLGMISAICTVGSARADTIQLKHTDLAGAGLFGWNVHELDASQSPASPLAIADTVDGSAAGMLRRLAAQGLASGLTRVLYDNRDRGHSALPEGSFPQLHALAYGPELREAGLDYGLAGEILFPWTTIGNSSTAVVGGSAPRSLARLAMTTPLGPARAVRAYAANHLYVYPEHQDHDGVDLFPATWPYMVISQGSSGSDQAFLQAALMTLASFTPDTRKFLEKKKLVAPTLQMILRRTQKGSYGPEAYHTALSHPTVFEATRLSPDRMVALAAAMKPEDVPPLMQLQVAREDFRSQAGLAARSERLFDTPSAIARVWRGLEYEKRITLDAGNTRDPNGRHLQFFWVVLRGDPQKIRISPSENRQQAEIVLNWHDTYHGTVAPERQSSRIDIGVFAWNGVHYSAPAFLSVSFPTHQVRHYKPGLDGSLNIAFVDYDALARGSAYDPLLHWSAPWRDIAEYDQGGDLTGWLRRMSDGQNWALDTEGRNDAGQTIAYHPSGAKEQPSLKMVPAN